jgi:hypothetical protein
MSELEECFSYEGPERRKHCELVVLVNQRFVDFLNRYENDKKDADGWRVSVTGTLGGMQKSMEDLARPYKLMMWLATISTGAFVVEGIKLVIGALKNKIHFG